MTNQRPIILSFMLLLGMGHAFAQQEVMVSQYMFNGLFLNPAQAGSHGYVTSSLLHRSQWLYVEGAPRTSMFAIDGPMMGNAIGTGFTVVHDQIGVTRDLDLAGHFAYRMRTGATSSLSFGLRAGLSLYSAQLSELQYWDTNDQVFQGNISNTPVGKFGFGMFWHDATSFVGLSVPTLFAADRGITQSAGQVIRSYFVQHYYLHAGKIFPLGDEFDIKPSVLVKYQDKAPLQADVNCNLLFRQRIWLGVGYRTSDAVVAMVEYQIDTRFRIGYAYDMTTSKLRTYSTGSHEVMLGFDMGRDLVKIKTPRYF
jgi:type IX secretion system PorP/SprF family membrane protein